MSTQPCSVDGCGSVANRVGAKLCERHYMRLRRTGTTDQTRPWQRRKGFECVADDCRRGQDQGDYCSMHSARVRAHGSPDVVIAPHERRLARGADHYMWSGDQPTYFAVHQRLVKVRGLAREQTCVDCGTQARQWSYSHRGENPLIQDGMPYSNNLDDYEPRCVPCHKRFDLDRIRREEAAVDPDHCGWCNRPLPHTDAELRACPGASR